MSGKGVSDRDRKWKVDREQASPTPPLHPGPINTRGLVGKGRLGHRQPEERPVLHLPLQNQRGRTGGHKRGHERGRGHVKGWREGE